jgi:purine nucleoside permease
MSEALRPAGVLVGMLDAELACFRERWLVGPAPIADLPDALADRLWWAADREVLLVRAGVGSANTAAFLSTLGMLPGLDLRGSSWLLQGIAGVDPAVGTLGDVFLVDHAVDADLAHELAGRDIPVDWQTGIFPLGAEAPFQKPSTPELFGEPYQHFPVAVADPPDDGWPALQAEETVAELAAHYPEAATSRAPAIQTGSVLSGARFWHGAEANDWARRWVDFWTEGRGVFAVSSMEDTGSLAALQLLGRMDRVDTHRIAIIRAASNFTTPPPGVAAIANLAGDHAESVLPAFALALENLYRVVSALYPARVAAG